jgi:hypothetical protein
MTKVCRKKLDRKGKTFGHYQGKRFQSCSLRHDLTLDKLRDCLDRQVERVRNGEKA